MRYSPRHAALALVLLASALEGFTPSAQCPWEEVRTGEPSTLVWEPCPIGCQCSSEDIQLQCPGPAMPTVDDAVARNLSTAAVNGVNIEYLRAQDLRGLEKVQGLTLSHGRISQIANDTFQELQHLRKLDLSDNEIAEIPVEAFAHNKELRWLVLSGNPLHVPPSGPLLRSESLGSLSMKRCGIRTLGRQTFAGVPKLFEILLEDNELTEFPTEAVSHLRLLCSVGVDEVIRNLNTDPGESPTGLDLTYIHILIIAGMTVLIVAACVGIYKILKAMACGCRRNEDMMLGESRLTPSNNIRSHSRSEAPAPMYAVIGDRPVDDGRGGYRILSQRGMHPTVLGYPGYVYNGVDFSSLTSRDRYSYVEDVGFYSPAGNYHRPPSNFPLPPPYENDGRTRLHSRKESVGTSTSDLHTSVISDDVSV